MVESFAVSGGALLHDSVQQRFIVLNDSAAVIWHLFAAQIDIEDIVTLIAERQPHKNRVELKHELMTLSSAWRANGLFDENHKQCSSLHTFNGYSDVHEIPLFEATVQLAQTCIKTRFFTDTLGPLVIDRLAHLRCDVSCDEVIADKTIDIYANDEGYFAVCDGSVVLRERDIPHAASSLYRLLLRLDNASIEFIAFFHAACLIREGRSVLLSGRSGRGKTTLAAGLLSQGWTYVGDEITGIVTDDFSVRSLVTALSIKVDGMAAVRAFVDAPVIWPSRAQSIVDSFIDPQSMGAVASAAPRPSAIVFPQYVPGSVLVTSRISTIDAFAELVDAGIALDDHLVREGRPERLIEFVETTPCYRVIYGSFDQAQNAVLNIVEN